MRSSRYWLFLGITVLTPALLFGAAELVARLVWREGALPLFVESPIGDGRYLVANRNVARRWFARERVPPAPMPEPFAAGKPARGFRVFVLGESSTAGFPYPRNGTFSRLLRDMLRDVLPQDSVEVVNLGIAATNSYALADIADEVLEQSPDAVVIYAGHNEYYGALGAASTENVIGGSPAVKRAYLWLLRSRLVMAMRSGLHRAQTGGTGDGEGDADAPSLMEVLARNREVPLEGEVYAAGVEQFESNLSRVANAFRDEGIPVFIGSLASNLRSQRPLASSANRGPMRAEGVFFEARRALAQGDATLAHLLFTRARDLDVVRFRAPTEFNRVIERVTTSTGAVYVPVAETAARQAPAGVPGDEFFLEHVHPNRAGYATMARVFFAAIRDAGFVGRPARLDRLRSPGDYVAGMELTAFDERVARHRINTLTTRWPFVPATRRSDYRGTYRPVDPFDSLAFAVSRGASWESAKLQLAAHYERQGRYDDAVAEYRGLVRDAPLFEEPLRFLGRALLAAGRLDEAQRTLERALALRPSAGAANALATLALERREMRRAIALLRQSLSLEPNQPDALYQLSMAYALSGDIASARDAAAQLRRIAPGREGLGEWMQALGMQR
ncbi:MAG: tetratricopeptide repeat protein [Gemmatimonadaceae bacterium]